MRICKGHLHRIVQGSGEEKERGSPLFQSPYDPDASYGHKGPGYSLHITETCGNAEKTEIITDYEVHGAARSDIGKALSVIERLDAAGLKPETLFADGGYPSVPSASKVIEHGIEFITPVNRKQAGRRHRGQRPFLLRFGRCGDPMSHGQ